MVIGLNDNVLFTGSQAGCQREVPQFLQTWFAFACVAKSDG
jgi:hypothetical protein